MSLNPSRSETKYSCRPSGVYCGLMCFAPGKICSSRTVPVAHVHQRQVHRAVLQRVEIGARSAIRRERERLAIRRPRGVQLRITIVRELTHLVRT